MKTPTALASMVRYAIDAAKDRGLDANALIAAAGLDMDVVNDIDGRVPVSALYRVWELSEELSKDPFYGMHVAERFASAQSIQVVGFAARTSETIADAIATVGRFARVMNESTVFELVDHGKLSALRIGPRPGTPPWPMVYAQLVLTGYWVVGRSLVEGEQELDGVTFQHAAPKDVSEYRRVFGQTPQFDSEVNSLRFNSEFLALPSKFADPALADYLRGRATVMMAQLPAEAELRDLVRRAILQSLGRADDVRAVARRLGMSSRSLQRSLQDAGASFQEIRDDVRRAEALALFDERMLSVGEIAARVGFAHTSALRAAVKRWTGKSTRDLRRDNTVVS
ncbi:MAG TPA: AraC family transcriptional regulator [Polyangiaceae bacterium]|nr:AraC family transcriptional regulator [Polyangiaceae bacterium]